MRSSTELFYAERDQFSSYLNTLYDPLLNKDDKTEIKKVLLCVCLKFELLCEMFAQWEDEKIREIEIADKRLERLYIYERDKGIYIYESDYGLIHFKSSSLIQSY